MRSAYPLKRDTSRKNARIPTARSGRASSAPRTYEVMGREASARGLAAQRYQALLAIKSTRLKRLPVGLHQLLHVMPGLVPGIHALLGK